MTKVKALCLDRQLCSNPEYIGLENENLLAQDWLEVLEGGEAARAHIREHQQIEEVWIAGCSDVEPINLAASMKKDRPGLVVRLVVGRKSGSLCTRANAAGVDDVIDLPQFVQLYAAAKSIAAQRASVPVAASVPAITTGDPMSSKPPATPALATTSGQASTSLPIAPSQGLTQLPSTLDTSRASMPAMSEESKQRPRRGFLMSVVSGSGGAGKSSVSVLAALHAADCGHRTLLLDFDLQFGDIASMVGSVDSLGIDALIADPERGRWVFSQQASLAVLTAPARLEQSEELVDKLPRLLDEAMRHFDVIVANTGANWAEQHALLLERSSVALFLLDQRSSSIRACHHALELCARCGIASVPFKFALNRCSKSAPFDSADVSGVMQGAPIFELSDGGAEVEECLASGHAAELRMQGNEFAKSVGRMMNRLLPKTNSAAPQQAPARKRERGRMSGRRAARIGRKRAKVAL